jgi:hypothetical protein
MVLSRLSDILRVAVRGWGAGTGGLRRVQVVSGAVRSSTGHTRE